MPKTGIPGSYGNSIVSVLKNLHAVLHSDRSNLQSHPQCRRVSFSSYPPQCLLYTDFSMMAILTRGFPDSSVGKESIGNAGDPDSWGRKSRRRRDRLPTPGFWPGKFPGLYTPWGSIESDRTEQLSLQFTHSYKKQLSFEGNRNPSSWFLNWSYF